MAYGRFRRRGFRRFGRRGYRSRRFRRRALTRGYIRGNRFEMKMVDDFMSGLVPTSAVPAVTTMNALFVGAGFWQRAGARLSMKNLYLKIFMSSNQNWTGQSCAYRIALVYDKQPRQAVPAVADIFALVDNTGALTTSQIGGFVNPSYRDRFVILMDKLWQEPGWSDLSNLTEFHPVSATGRNMMIKKYIRLRSLETLYNNGNTGTIADIQSGALLLYFISNAVAASGSPYIFSMYSRLRFTD